ncbi:MAG: RNA polymerase sigma factor [Bacteroidales bacterium]
MDIQKLQTDFIELIENNKKMIYKVSHMYCDSTIDKKDLFQDIISNLWISYPTFQNKSKISTWIYKVSLNTAITWFRDYTKQSRSIEYTNLIPNLEDEADNTTHELYDQLYSAINSLGKIDRAVILLLLDEYSYEEIAEIIGISRTNVATKISRIKLRLRDYLSINKN